MVVVVVDVVVVVVLVDVVEVVVDPRQLRIKMEFSKALTSSFCQPVIQRLSWSTDALVIAAVLPDVTDQVVVAVLGAQEVGPVVAFLAPGAAETPVCIPVSGPPPSPLLTLASVAGHDVAHDVLLVEGTRGLLEQVTVI